MTVALDLESLKQPIQAAIAQFEKHADVNQLIVALQTCLIDFIEELIVTVLQQRLYDRQFLTSLKPIGGEAALRFNGYRPTSIRLLSGRSIPIVSPYFAKARSKARAGRKGKKRQAKSGRHLGLSYLGFIGRCSTWLASAAVQAALLCPSFEIAKRTLQSYGIELDVKTIRRLCLNMGEQAIEYRPAMALSELDTVEDRILGVFIDGGRLRERSPKRGRRPASQKRQGYHTPWREPIQLVIQWFDAEGKTCEETLPLYDATLGGSDAAFDLLEGYLRQLDASKAELVIFCADGDRKLWKRFPALAESLNIKTYCEVIDYTHAKQNLQEVLDKLPKKLGATRLATIAREWKDLLWKGKLVEIYHQIRDLIKSPKKRKAALTKFKNYFLKNFRRMQYAAFRHLDLPTGSGCVESAIRRVINLRLKSPGIFWKRQTAEAMLYLRSTLLCGRWDTMLNNLRAVNRGQFVACN